MCYPQHLWALRDSNPEPGMEKLNLCFGDAFASTGGPPSNEATVLTQRGFGLGQVESGAHQNHPSMKSEFRATMVPCHQIFQT